MKSELVGAAAMRAIDASCGIAPMELMENAARAASRVAATMLEGSPGRRVVIVAGSGNNGGDGFALARLMAPTCRVRIATDAREDDLKGETLENFRRAKAAGVELLPLEKAGAAIADADLVVDALLGTGSKPRPFSPEWTNLIAALNGGDARSHRVLSLDLPTGVDPDTGQIFSGSAVRADATVTFGRAKPGLYLYPGTSHAGDVVVVDIGIPDRLFADLPGRRHAPDEIARLLPRRAPTAHKGSSKLLVIGGSAGMAGAAALAAFAALKTGAGYVFLAMPRGAADSGWPVEAVRHPLPAREGGLFDRAAEVDAFKMAETVHAVVLGGGMGLGDAERVIASRLTRLMKTPAVVDADALRQISAPDLFEAGAARVVTPHVGEFVSLFGSRAEDVERDRIGVTVKAAARAGQIVVLKGRPTIVAAPDGRYALNATGNELLATCGSGDALAGVVGALLAQGLDPFSAAVAAVNLHGLTAALWPHPVGLTASEIAGLIPAAWGSILAAR